MMPARGAGYFARFRPILCSGSSIPRHCRVVALQGMSLPKVLILAGPTGVGKTELSLSLAEKLNGEIISADSVQVYRGLDVGSDKISVERRRGIPHHMVDVLEVSEDFSAGVFFDKARQITMEILERNRTPIIVGGTGLYLKWFTQGKPGTQERSEELRQVLDNRLQQAWTSAELLKGSSLSDEEKWDEGIKLLEDAGDQEAADRIRKETNNYCRLIRALEIVVGTGRVMSELDIDPDQQPDYDFRCFFLSRPRLDLFQRIGRRCEQMLVEGILAEATTMLDIGLVPGQNCATRAIGYRQTMEFLQPLFRGEDSPTEKALIQLVLDIQSATRQLIRHQTNWFKKDGNYQLIDVSNENIDVCQHIISEFNQAEHKGGFGDFHLTKEELKLIKCYLPSLYILSDSSNIHPVMKWLADNVQMRTSCQQN